LARGPDETRVYGIGSLGQPGGPLGNKWMHLRWDPTKANEGRVETWRTSLKSGGSATEKSH
jgi:hypothetical protein